MCLAILKPGNASVPEEHLRQGWIHNSDGAGFAYIKKGKVQIKKGFSYLKDFLDAYEETVKKFPKSPMLIHFRIRSQGDRTPENTHPFRINGGALCHNGTINGTNTVFNSGPSDTRVFAEKLDGKVDKKVLADHKADWDKALDWNKVAFLFDDGSFHIINEHMGHWRDGVWYSNNGYERSGLPASSSYMFD